MKERPILFSRPMVRAILAGRKTQTRRVGKIQSPHYTELGTASALHQTKGVVIQATYRAYPSGGTARWAICECPHGKPGDRLWVRETWAAPHACDGHKPREVPPGTRIHYAADGTLGGLLGRPSIFMPRWASRITLEIASVRVERLTAISEQDAIAEGVEPRLAFPQNSFRTLWESINGPASWEVNPWVWVLTFTVVH